MSFSSAAEIQAEIERVTQLALTYINANKADLVVFVGQIDYNGYDAGKLLSILKEKAVGRDFAKDLCLMLIMRYTRGTGFIRDVKKKIKVAQGGEKASEVVLHYGIKQAVGEDTDALTLGRLAALFPAVSMTIVTTVSTGAKLAVDSSDMGTSGMDLLLWDFVPQFITIDSESAPYCTKKDTSNILFSLQVLQGALTTRKTMPDAKKKLRNLLTDYDLVKYTCELLVITSSAKNLTNDKKAAYRRKLMKDFRSDEGAYKAEVWTKLAEITIGCVRKLKKDAQAYLKGQSSVLALMVNNADKTAKEATDAFEAYFATND